MPSLADIRRGAVIVSLQNNPQGLTVTELVQVLESSGYAYCLPKHGRWDAVYRDLSALEARGTTVSTDAIPSIWGLAHGIT